MMKEKRKIRLDKVSGSSGTEFIGFSAFADISSPLSAGLASSNDVRRRLDHQSSTASSSPPTLTAWTPVYEGKDERFGALFARIRDKRDSITVGRALRDLQELIADTTIHKPIQAEALQHWAWLYHSKLHYDNNAPVRAASMQTWFVAWKRVPKVVSNLVSLQPELLGMMYTVLVDPSAEVRAVATSSNDFFPREQDSNTANDDSILSTSSWPWQQGVLAYVNRMLSYDRPGIMHDEIFARKKDAALELNDRGKDLLDERYERIISTALSTLEYWILTFSTNNSVLNGIEIEDTSKWWKHFFSPKALLRRRTYSLLRAVSSKAPLHMPPEDVLVKKMSQALSSEKEASNLPTILETILSVIACYRKLVKQPNPSLWSSIVKPLSKVFKKACFGAKVDQWGPILLPLTVQLSEIVDTNLSTEKSINDESLVSENSCTIILLKSVHSGLELTLGDVDKYNLVAAISECTSFQLLRKRSSMTLTKETALLLIRIWLDLLKYILSMSNKIKGSRSTPTQMLPAGKMEVLKQLAKELLQFQDATTSRPECAFFTISEWFWNDGLNFSGCEIDNLTQFIHYLRINSSQQDSSVSGPLLSPDTDSDPTQAKRSLFLHPLRQQVNHVLSQYQISSQVVPTESAYQLFLAAFDFCGPLSMFHENPKASLEKFIMNDLLRWIVIHTSTLSTQQQTQSFVEQDFRLLDCCLNSIVDQRNALWESLLREVFAAKCDLKWLVLGVRQILKAQNHSTIDWVRCQTLDSFAISTGTSLDGLPDTHAAAETADSESVDSSGDSAVDYMNDWKLNFFKLCLDLEDSSDPTRILINTGVLSSWIESNCISWKSEENHLTINEEEHNPVIEALLLVVEKKRNLLSESQVDHILLEAWYRLSSLYDTYSLPLFRKNGSLLNRFLSKASLFLKADLERIVSTRDDPDVLNLSNSWALRAWRALDVGHRYGNWKLSLGSVGLGDSSAWQESPDIYFLLCMTIFENLDSIEDRLSLAHGPQSGQASTESFMDLLLALSEASSDVLLSARTRTRQDRCWLFLEALGGRSLNKSFLEDVVRAIVVDLEAKVKQQYDALNEKQVCRGGAVLSQLLDLLFTRIIPTCVMELRAEDVVEGSQLWYIPTPENPNDRQLVKVIKVHHDDQLDFYFTIELDCNGQKQERQTVVERLQRKSGSDLFTEELRPESISDEEWMKRSEIRDFIFEKLSEPLFASAINFWSLWEIISTVVCQLGVGSERGLGSVHYEIFRRVNSAEEQLRQALLAKNIDVAAKTMWALAAALGIGLNCPSSPWVIVEIRINAAKTCEAIMDCYNHSTELNANFDFDCSVLAWLVVAIPSLTQDNKEGNKILFTSLTLIFRLSCAALEAEQKGEFTGSTLLACQAVYTAMVFLDKQSSSISDFRDELASDLAVAKSHALHHMIRSFSSGWNSSRIRLDHPSLDKKRPDWLFFSAVPALLKLATTNAAIRRSLGVASAKTNTDLLSAALYDESKRRYAFLLLDAVASLGYPYRNRESEIQLSIETSIRLQKWVESAGSDEAGAEEIMTDIYIVAEWIPLSMMKEIECWSEDVQLDVEEATIAGRLLTWMAFLRFVDFAAPTDFSIRPAFVSYISKCGAINSILNLALVNNKAISDRKYEAITAYTNPDDVFLDESTVNVPKLAALSLLRTIEVFPSLSRRWWEEDCSKIYTSLVQGYVEKHVAPEILRRELERIKSVTTFGPMKVTASLASREVTASYVQDDFTLTVMITFGLLFLFVVLKLIAAKL